jgi:concentrative nucleoside transporter, CNT family
MVWTGLLGILIILALCWVFSKNKQAIAWPLVAKGLLLQVVLGVLLLKVPVVTQFMQALGSGIEGLLAFADKGAAFVFGAIVSQPETMQQLFGNGGHFIFAIKLVSTLVLVSSLVSIAYHLRLLQLVVQGLAWFVNKTLGVSGAEALSNCASVFVGQVEAQLLVKPYLAKMTESELLTVMTGSMACISGGTMAIYIGLGIPAHYLLSASLMAIPGALVIAKMLFPETEMPETGGNKPGALALDVDPKTINIIDAAAQGASEGWHIGVQVIVMLVAFISLIALLDAGLTQLGQGLLQAGVSLSGLGVGAKQPLTLQLLLGQGFQWVAMALGVPAQQALLAGGLMGTKLVVNEFVAYTQLMQANQTTPLDAKTLAIVTFALCGFANFGSVAIQLGGLGAMVPQRKPLLARLGLWALLAGSLASYLSAAWAGIIISVHWPVMAGVNQAGWLAIVIGLALGYWVLKPKPRPVVGV